MGIPVINLEELNGKRRNETLSVLHEACAKWGFFWIENHGISKQLMEKVTELTNQHYEKNLKENFYKSEWAKELESESEYKISDIDWESSFFIRHQPNPNFSDIPNLNEKLCKGMKDYVDQLIMVAETLAKGMSENLGLEKNYIKNAFSEPCVGTKVAKYPQCSKPDLVIGLRAHTDAGGIILLLQDDTVPGLEFFKDGEWVPVTPTKENRIFVNLGDQLEVVSNGIYKSILHRVLADKDGSRLSIATFYNPGGNAIISPAPKFLYPNGYRFKDYLNFYSKTKFSDKEARFETFKEMNM
ncbi:1-aminocyclopropane-1-carboxylate oxidase 1-like [Asparagus officinalis]|uniref:1-aminocyclopropane-1-carboxylate oxidase 1-like n=1 Tax=Asparagus officinalis TaxID=4686 RepID=UPI00098E48E1|nr:1-aminocyclopropane-1-carboxylate oxidase 1-like [Asparagus officinalis]XP_020272612.1 1-aminocyclopropane-1-carboxylate oxidase 1-like [Asparagus officinalis]